MRTTAALLFTALLVVGCKKNDPEPAAKEPDREDAVATSQITPAEPEPEEPERVETVAAPERGSCAAIAERVVELAMEKEEEPAFRKKDVEALTEACKGVEDTEVKKTFAECIDGAADLEAAKKDCDVISTAKGWME